MNQLIAFLTDYGTRDGFVATCHGVMAEIAPQCRVVDITHEVPHFDIRHGAVVLAQTAPYLPPGVIVAVVDPGVGSARRGIAIVTPRHVLVGPDNGLLLRAADAVGGLRHAYELGDRTFWRESGAATFDGRDIFAPVAAHIVNGTEPAEVGREIALGDLVRLPEPRREVHEHSISAEVLIVDHFGNLTLSADGDDLTLAGLTGVENLAVDVGDRRVVVPFARAFSDVGRGELFSYVDASGKVALAVNQGSAAAMLELAAGFPVTLSA